MNLQIVKSHPYVTGAVGIVGIVILYMILKSRSSASGGANSAADLSSESSLAAVQQGSSVALAQSSAAQSIADLNANVATNQVNAQLAAVKDTNATALAIVGTQESSHVQQNLDTVNGTVAVATVNANAAKDIATTEGNTYLGIAGVQADVAKTQIASLSDVAKTLGTQKQLGSKVGNVLAVLQGPQAIAANQPTSVATVNASAAGGPVGILNALNPAKLLSGFAALFG
jgi:hypothetical protein